MLGYGATKMKTEYRVFYKNKKDDEWSGSKAECETFKKNRVERHGWDESKFEIKGGFKPREGFSL